MKTLTGTIKAGADVGYDTVDRVLAWSGLMAFAGAYVLGHGLAHVLIVRSMDEEIRRRRNLKAVAANSRKPT